MKNCKKHLYANFKISSEGEEDSFVVKCVHCGERKIDDWCEHLKEKYRDGGTIDSFNKFQLAQFKVNGKFPASGKRIAIDKFHIEENLEVITNQNVFNAEKYFEK